MKNKPTHEQLIANAQAYAETHLRKQGNIPPMFRVVTPDESFSLFPENVEDDKARESFGFFARLTCAAHGAIGAMFVAEAWVSAIEPGERIRQIQEEALQKLRAKKQKTRAHFGLNLQC